MSNTDMAAERMIGGFSPLDGTVEFYGRVNAIVKTHHVVVDLGAGRASWFHDDPSPYRRSLQLMKGKVQSVIGLDIDAAVLRNPSTDQNMLVEGAKLPLVNESVDILIADYVLEHIQDPETFEAEVFRVLKVGGTFCARTPHTLNYVSIGARVIGNRKHSAVLSKIQPGRKPMDIFPTAYRANTFRAIRRTWAPVRWEDHSYLYTAQPMYHFGSRFLYQVLTLAHKILPAAVVGNLFLFMVKRGEHRQGAR